MSNPTLHFVVVPWLTLSHFRQMAGLVYNLVRVTPQLRITILSHRITLSEIRAELERYGQDDALLSRIRVIGIVQNVLTEAPAFELPRQWKAIARDFERAYTDLVTKDLLVCTDHGAQFDFQDFPMPSLVIHDMYICNVGQTVRRVTPNARCLLFFPSTVHSFMRLYGPTSLGGLEDWEARARDALEVGYEEPDLEVLARTLSPPEDFEHTAREIELEIVTADGKLPQMDGINMHLSELRPQDITPHRGAVQLMQSIHEAREETDGAIIASIPLLGEQATSAAYQWYAADLQKSLFVVGPQVPPAESIPPNHEGILQFLDAQRERSTFVISFGGIYFPYTEPGPTYVRILLDLLLDHRIPFIFSRLSEGFVPDALPFRLRSSEAMQQHHVLVVDYFPQREVLRHPSIAAFVTTGSALSMWESIMAGVIPVFWPIAVDHSTHAALLSTSHNCAYELHQVRTGPATSVPALGNIQVQQSAEAVRTEMTTVVERILPSGDGVAAQWRENLRGLREAVTTFAAEEFPIVAERIVKFANGMM